MSDQARGTDVGIIESVTVHETADSHDELSGVAELGYN